MKHPYGVPMKLTTEMVASTTEFETMSANGIWYCSGDNDTLNSILPFAEYAKYDIFLSAL